MNFISAIQKEAYCRTRQEENNIRKRNKYIDEQFELTPKVYEKLVLLNKKLQQEERRIFYQYRKIQKQCVQMIGNKEIDDFNIEVIVKYWNNKHYKKYEPSIDGNPFFETNCVGDFMTFQQEADYNSFRHNENHNQAPFPEINHCYSFHHLYDHTNLTWFDIYNIDEVWMEIKVDYQFFATI